MRFQFVNRIARGHLPAMTSERPRVVNSLDDVIYRNLVATRVKLLFDNPPVGQALARFALVEASDWCESIATDGRNLFYNREFIGGLSRRELLDLMTDFSIPDPSAEPRAG